MNAERARKEKIAVIGAGRVGTALARAVAAAGYDVAAICDSNDESAELAAGEVGARVMSPGGSVRSADVVVITTPDASIEEACGQATEEARDLSGKKFIHMSGALSTDALSSAARKGADVLSIHPLQTFPDADAAARSLPGSRFGVTCDDDLWNWASGLVKDLGGEPLAVADEQKVLYHAAAVIACNLFAMLEHSSQRLLDVVGFDEETARRAFAPLVVATCENIAAMGAREALTGPLARGDAETVGAHLEALSRLDSDLSRMYAAVCLWGLRMVGERGEVAREDIEEMRMVLEEYV